jgi:nucleoid-associated protein YgaU
METDKKSRYVNTPLVKHRHPSGEEYELRELRAIPDRTAVFAATPVQGDRLDLLSARYYRDPLLFWRIADAADQLDPFDIVSPGEPVRIPPNKDK